LWIKRSGCLWCKFIEFGKEDDGLGWEGKTQTFSIKLMKFHRNTSRTSLTKGINGLVDMKCSPALHGENLLLGFFGPMTTQFIVGKGFNKVHKCSPNALKTTFIAIKFIV
jgi:hypothetical protein